MLKTLPTHKELGVFRQTQSVFSVITLLNYSKERENTYEEDDQTNELHSWPTQLTQETKGGARNSVRDCWGHTGWQVKAHLAPLKTHPYDTAPWWTGHVQNSRFDTFLMLFWSCSHFTERQRQRGSITSPVCLFSITSSIEFISIIALKSLAISAFKWLPQTATHWKYYFLFWAK